MICYLFQEKVKMLGDEGFMGYMYDSLLFATAPFRSHVLFLRIAVELAKHQGLFGPEGALLVRLLCL